METIQQRLQTSDTAQNTASVCDTGGVIGASRLFDRLENFTQASGFRRIHRQGNEGESLFEYDGLRLRLTAMPDGGVRVDGLIPRADNLAEFLLEANDPSWWTGIHNGLILRRCAVADEASGIDAIRGLRTATVVVAKQDRPPTTSFLRALGQSRYPTAVPDAFVAMGKALLTNTRALGVRGSLTDLWLWLAALAPSSCCFSVRSEMLQTQPDKVAEFLRNDTAKYNGACIVAQLACLLNDAWRHCFYEVISELAQADPDAGARVLFLVSSDVPGGLPVIDLPDFQAVAAVAQKDEPVLRRVLGRSGLDTSAHDQLIKDTRHAADTGPAHGVTVVRSASGQRIGDLKRLQCWRARIIEACKDVVGHAAIIENVARVVALWMARDESAPLVLSFTGPSGTGKNMLAQALANALASQEFMALRRPNYVTINMALAIEKKAWSLVGAGVGHVGAERPGLLESATGQPGYVISLDEIDKQIGSGDGDPQGLLVSLFENGGFRNGHAHWVSFPKGIFILTLNCGIQAEGEHYKRIGFTENTDEGARCQWIEAHYRDYYQKNLIAPLRGRIHHPFFFGELNHDDLRQLAIRELDKLQQEDAVLGATWPRQDTEHIASELIAATDPAQGARGLLREVERFRESMLDALFKPHVKDSVTSTHKNRKTK